MDVHSMSSTGEEEEYSEGEREEEEEEEEEEQEEEGDTILELHDGVLEDEGDDVEAAAQPGAGTHVTKEDVENGQDPQGIPWATLDTSRVEYRKSRLQNYLNYENLRAELTSAAALEEEVRQHHVRTDAQFFNFENNERQLRSSIVHFQLRNLVWATSSHDVLVVHVNDILHYNYHTQRTRQVISLNGLQGCRVQISTMAVQDNLCIAGGFYGDIVCVRVPHDLCAHTGSKREGSCGQLLYCDRITVDDNAITNSIVFWNSPTNGNPQAVISNNDACVRIIDIENGFVEANKFSFPWSVNYTAISPEGKLACVVGDATEAVLVDVTTGQKVGQCDAHLDYSFAVAWHPEGNIFVTGNQDKTARIWDRRTLRCLAVLQGRIGAVRSLRFTSDGNFLALAEPADFVRIFDVRDNFHSSQEIDMFGEVSGISFSPDGDTLFVGIADRVYGSMMQFRRRRRGMLSAVDFCL